MMRRRVLLRTGAAVALAVPLLVLAYGPSPVQASNRWFGHRALCTLATPGFGHCSALFATNAQGQPFVTPGPAGYSPSQIDGAYGLPGGTSGTGETIAIVDAYNDPTAASDLAAFSSQYGLPACSTAPCFRQVNETGGSSLPATDSGWALEISLDIEWAHAVAPGASILLVEASSNSFADLLAAEDYAGANAQYVSNSWGGSEFSGENTYDSHFTHAGVSYFVAAGDAGLPAEYPSSSPNVVSVGGTTLHPQRQRHRRQRDRLVERRRRVLEVRVCDPGAVRLLPVRPGELLR